MARKPYSAPVTFAGDPMRRFLAALSLCLLPLPGLTQTAEEQQFATALLRNINPLSMEFNREVCGYIVRGPDGRLTSTKLSWGSEARCASLPIPEGVDPISSWHTHAGYDRTYDSEVPSTLDVEGDMRFGVNGWIATPGGRLWFVNGDTGVATQVCGTACLPQDPDFVPQDYGPIAKTYSLDELRARFGE